MRSPAKPAADHEPPATEAVLVSEIIPATRERIFAAWMDSDQHSAFTGEPAVIDAKVGGLHSSFDGYASGTTMALEPFRRIVQTWRSLDFPQASPDSLLEITLEETVGGTLVTLLHSEIPTGQSDRCRDGWLRLYLEPLKRFFAGRLSNGVHAADEKALAASRSAATSPRRKRAGKSAARTGPSATPRRKAGGRARPVSKTSKPRAGKAARAGGAKPAKSSKRAGAAAARAPGKARKKTSSAGATAKRTAIARKRARPTRRAPSKPAAGKRAVVRKGPRKGVRKPARKPPK